MHAIRVMLVEDEEDFREPIARYLTKVGMTVSGVGSVEEMEATFASFRPDVIVLDVNLPGESGFSVAARLRRQTDAGLVMLTAHGGVEDRIQSLSVGADIHLGKPVNTRELEAVIRNLSARLAGSAPPPTEPTWVFDANRWTLSSPDGTKRQLSAAEYRILAALIAAPGQPVTRGALFDALGRPCSGPEDRSLDVLVSRLRRKFAASTFGLPIQAVRGIGYVFPQAVAMRGTPSPHPN